ncbi:MAG: ATP-binding protein [Nibricoccus sp.]
MPGTNTNDNLSAPVLGQLLLMQSVLCNLPDETSIFSFVGRGLLDVPGVAKVEHSLETSPKLEQGRVRYPLQAGESRWGELVVTLSDQERFRPYEAYVLNFCVMVAMILEERKQRRLNQEHQLLLEQRVGERTRQLAEESEERRLMAEQLQRGRNMIAHVLDSIPQAVFWKDREGRYLGCNRIFAEAAGLGRPEEVIGRTDFDLPWSKDDAEAYRRDDRGVTEDAKSKKHIAEALQRADGKRILIDTTKVPLVDSEGRVYGVLGVFEDITERRRAEEENTKLQAQLTQAQKMESIGRLAGGVAHDFNNMLQAILGHASLAMDGGVDADSVREGLQEITNAARRSAELTHQLLAFARKQTVSPKVLDLNAAVGKVLKMLQRLIGEDIELVWHPQDAVWPVWMDPVQLDQVLANLVVNARDAIKGVGRITIATSNLTQTESASSFRSESAPGDYVVLRVSDTGGGMSKEVKEHLFEPFFTTKPLGQGTGLGLATVYGIVKQNNGYIAVSSEPGNGTVFTIQLPRCDLPSVSTAFPLEEKVKGGHETILLVEDEQQILNLGKRILELHGYSVLTARDPETALRVVEQYTKPIHLLITDVVMPGMNGRQLRTCALGIKPGIKCLYISGYSADVIAHQGILDDGVQFLPKPFSIPALARKVREVLDPPSA